MKRAKTRDKHYLPSDTRSGPDAGKTIANSDEKGVSIFPNAAKKGGPNFRSDEAKSLTPASNIPIAGTFIRPIPFT